MAPENVRVLSVAADGDVRRRRQRGRRRQSRRDGADRLRGRRQACRPISTARSIASAPTPNIRNSRNMRATSCSTAKAMRACSASRTAMWISGAAGCARSAGRRSARARRSLFGMYRNPFTDDPSVEGPEPRHREHAGVLPSRQAHGVQGRQPARGARSADAGDARRLLHLRRRAGGRDLHRPSQDRFRHRRTDRLRL